MGNQIKKEARTTGFVWTGRLRSFAESTHLMHMRHHLQISIMKMVKHDNVVKLYEVLASRTKVSSLIWALHLVFAMKEMLVVSIAAREPMLTNAICADLHCA